jgi:hypothetical protein
MDHHARRLVHDEQRRVFVDDVERQCFGFGPAAFGRRLDPAGFSGIVVGMALFNTALKLRLPAPDAALPAATPPCRCRTNTSSTAIACRRVSCRTRAGGVRHGLLLGRRAKVLGGARRLQHRVGTPAATRPTRPIRKCARE